MGQHFVNGALNRDYSLVLGLTVIIGALTILFTAIVDILYGFIDPKIRLEGVMTAVTKKHTRMGSTMVGHEKTQGSGKFFQRTRRRRS